MLGKTAIGDKGWIKKTSQFLVFEQLGEDPPLLTKLLSEF